MESVYLIVGLGNPGAEYARTHHNAGFMVAERLAEQWRACWSMENRFQARVARADRGERKVLLVEPQTYMNLSGTAVSQVMNYYRVPLAHLLVIVDDADLPFGEIRMRARGSSGGHHGLESLEQHLGSRNYARLRMGIGREAGAGRQITSFVLGRFKKEQAEMLKLVLERATAQTECWLHEGVEKAMNQFNGLIETPGTKDS
jgi:peptidyl-tRNA hydrolase, PTH1 family